MTSQPDFSRNCDDLRKLCDEVQEEIDLQKTRIEKEVTESYEEIKQWFERQPKKALNDHLEVILQNIKLAKDKAMVN
jgi:tartrate dehydratase alpha subunit/fumarate hydratase class I-like protein